MKVIVNPKKMIPSPIKDLIRRLGCLFQWDKWQQRVWSQEGEDKILQRMFERQPKGFYVDVGAHHPKRFSNTYLFYRLGWRGINIDAMPGSMSLFRKYRPRDINIELGVGREEGRLDYYLFNEPALNGFSRKVSVARNKEDTAYRVKEVKKIDVRPLSVILDQYLPDGQEIDFLSVDVEGWDYNVLASNDWQRFRPKVVLAEILFSSLNEIANTEVGRLMRDAGYDAYAKSVNTVFFVEHKPKRLG